MQTAVHRLKSLQAPNLRLNFISVLACSTSVSTWNKTFRMASTSTTPKNVRLPLDADLLYCTAGDHGNPTQKFTGHRRRPPAVLHVANDGLLPGWVLQHMLV